MRAGGTTTVECKSGYGLTVDDEARSLRLAGEVTAETTYLGAHVVPAEYRDDRDEYVDLVTGAMLDACAPYARWVDVFCDRGAFDADETRAILHAGMSRGLLPRLHANQLQHGPGVRLAVELGAASVDHCTHLDDADVAALAGLGHRRDAAAGRGVLDAVAVPGRAPAARRRGDGRAGDGLQPRVVVHLEHGVLRRARRARDADDAGRGGVVRDRGRRGRAASRRRGDAASPVRART